jgi:tetratricopeptide (TPR) repeat protein
LHRYLDMMVSCYLEAPDFLGRPIPDPCLPTSQALYPGQILGGCYRILRTLGRGGMGEVYEAVDLELGEGVALKRISPVLVESPAVSQQFRREIALARRVTHRNVCRVDDFSYLPGPPAELILTMEYLDGQTLHDLIKTKGPLPADVAIRYLEQIFDGLEAAHHAGIVHRDLRPSNIMITPDGSEHGRVVILDFGLALSPQAVTTEIGKIPVGGMPAYTPPEQRRGDELAPSTDIFALGVVMHEMLTGRTPSPGSALTKLLSDAESKAEPAEPSAPSVAGTQIPKKWARCILRCIEPDPLDRPQSVSELRELLLGKRFSRRALLGAAAASCVSIVAAAKYWGRPAKGSRTEVAAARGAYERARLHASRTVRDELMKAVEYYQEAVRLDPEFALAHAGLASAYASLTDYGGMPYREIIPKAEAAAGRAVETGPELAVSHAALGHVRSLSLDHWGQAEESFQKAIALDPNYAQARQWFSAHLARIERFPEALEQASAAARSDAASPGLISFLGYLHYFSGDCSKAIAHGLDATALDPNYLYGYVLLARAYTEVGQFQDARIQLRKAEPIAERLDPSHHSHNLIRSAEACIFAAEGYVLEAMERAWKLSQHYESLYIPVHYIVSISSLCGDFDLSFQLLEQGLEISEPGVLYARVYPPLRRLREDARYRDFLSRLGVDTGGETGGEND